jgi:hypothetical protein
MQPCLPVAPAPPHFMLSFPRRVNSPQKMQFLQLVTEKRAHFRTLAHFRFVSANTILLDPLRRRRPGAAGRLFLGRVSARLPRVHRQLPFALHLHSSTLPVQAGHLKTQIFIETLPCAPKRNLNPIYLRGASDILLYVAPVKWYLLGSQISSMSP